MKEPRCLARLSWLADLYRGQKQADLLLDGATHSTFASVFSNILSGATETGIGGDIISFQLQLVEWMDCLLRSAANSWLPFVMCVLMLKNSCSESVLWELQRLPMVKTFLAKKDQNQYFLPLQWNLGKTCVFAT